MFGLERHWQCQYIGPSSTGNSFSSAKDFRVIITATISTQRKVIVDFGATQGYN